MTPAERVRAERLARKWSVRTACAAGGISNTWWGKFEDGFIPLTDGIVAAVARDVCDSPCPNCAIRPAENGKGPHPVKGGGGKCLAGSWDSGQPLGPL